VTRGVRRVAGAVLAVLVTAGIAALSRVPYEPTHPDEALIRLSWRTPGAFVEECRTPSPEELERLPVHMRRERICEGRLVPYRLHVALDGRVVIDEVVRAAGAREDRPLYVFRELPVPAGEHRLEVVWEEAEAGAAALRGLAGRPGEAPPRLTLDARVRLAPRDISLVTYDMDERVLVARGRGRPEGSAP
jgi:hypothetical protein